MTFENFAEIFSLLSLQLRLTDSDELTVRGFYDALKDLPVDAVQTAARSFAVEKNRRFFPTTAEWHTNAKAHIAAVRQKQLDVPRDTPWRFECQSCEDVGWVHFHCSGDASCGRRNAHAEHDFVVPCDCRASNRTYQRHHERA